MNGVPVASMVLLLLALGGPSAYAFLKHGDKSGPINKTRHLSAMWGICLALLAIVLWWEDRPLSSIGIAWGNYQAWAIGALMGLTVLTISIQSVHLSLQRGQGAIPPASAQGFKRLTDTPLWFRCVGVLTAGITEEIMFRGVAIERLLEMTGSLWLAALIPLAVFVVGHLGGWSVGHLVGVFIGGLLLTLLYLWTRDLVACMIAHVLFDTPLLILPWLIKRFGERRAAGAT